MLRKYRKQIDKIDKQIVKLIARRKKTVRKLWAWKRKKDIPRYDARREKELIQDKKKLSKKLGLNSKFIESIFKKIIKSNK